MDKRLAFLKDFGFVSVGNWYLCDGGVRCSLDPTFATKTHSLYTFSHNENLVYVGVTTLMLQERFRRYAHPPKKRGNGGGTNIKNNRNIREALLAGGRVDIMAKTALFTAEQCELLGRPLHQLEDQLRVMLRPEWNDLRGLPPL